MPIWRRWINLIVFLVILSFLLPIDKVTGVIAFFTMVIFLIGLYSLFGRKSYVPLAVVPIAYSLIHITPAIEYLLLKMALRRGKRVRAFLKLADDLRMRKKRVDGFLPRRPGG